MLGLLAFSTLVAAQFLAVIFVHNWQAPDGLPEARELSSEFWRR